MLGGFSHGKARSLRERARAYRLAIAGAYPLAQWDILEFGRDPKHVSPDFQMATGRRLRAQVMTQNGRKAFNRLRAILRAMISLVTNLEPICMRHFVGRRTNAATGKPCFWRITMRITLGRWWICGGRWEFGKSRNALEESESLVRKKCGHRSEWPGVNVSYPDEKRCCWWRESKLR